MTNENITDIIIVQDRSGSMANIRESAQSGINEFIQKQRLAPGETYVSFFQFDDFIDTLYIRRRIDHVQPYELVPRGMTALRDAIGTAIHRLGSLYRELDEYSRPGKVYFVVNTDGLENSSRKYTQYQINEMIRLQRDEYSWEFVFLAANQDAIATGTSLGFAATSSLTYGFTERGSSMAYAGAGDAILRSRLTNTAVAFNNEERLAAIDEN